jgi:membrane protein implicated in regulation of membrane protease activity
MTRRKLIAAALFFTAFGAFAFMPPLVLLFRFDMRILGVPVETVYVFVLWVALVIGARWFSRVMPDDRAQPENLPGRSPRALPENHPGAAP